MKLDCSALLTTVVLCLGLELNLSGITAVPISNYGDYRPETYFIKATVIKGQGSHQRPPWSTGGDEIYFDDGRREVFDNPAYTIRFRSGLGVRRPTGDIVFPSSTATTPSPPQRPRTHSRRPLLTPERNTPRWSTELGQDGKPLEKHLTAVRKDNPPGIESSVTPSNNGGSKEDLEGLFGDFYNWMGSNSKSKDNGNAPMKKPIPDPLPNRKSPDNLSSGPLQSKPPKFVPLGDEDIATKTNFVTGNEENAEEDSLDGMDVTEQSLLNALNDKNCPPGYKRVPSGECKPKVSV